MWIFKDRKDAGEKLGAKLSEREWNNPVVLGLPRGGVVVAHEVARHLGTPLNVVIARKIGAPGHPEYGIGAISEDEKPLFNPEAAGSFNVHGPAVIETVMQEKEELRRRISFYRGDSALPDLKGRTVLLIDDGLATGVSAAAAGKFLRSLNPAQVILAVPVGPRFVGELVAEQFDEIICLYRPENFFGVGQWYDDFSQTEDEEVIAILGENQRHQRGAEQEGRWES